MKKFITAVWLISLVQITSAQITIPNGKAPEFVSEDGLFRVKMGFRFQNLFIAEETSDKFLSDPQINTLVRRSRLKFDGFLLDTNFTFKFEMGMSNRDIEARSDYRQVGSASRLILDAVAKYKVAPGLELWFGQTKLPSNRERVVSSNNLQLVDRSLLNSRFNIDRDMGFQVHYECALAKNMIYRLIGAWSMGEGRNITVGNQGGLDYTGRVEFLPLGLFSKSGDYSEADLRREKNHKVAIGFTFDYNDNASRQRGQLGNFVTDTAGNPYFTDLQTIFADLMYKYRGFSFLFEYANKKQTTGMKPMDQVGMINPSTPFFTGSSENFQMGYLFKNNVEVAGRFTTVRQDNTESGVKNEDQYTVGISKYFIGHKLKIQSDFSLLDEEGSEHPELMYRFQVEFGF